MIQPIYCLLEGLEQTLRIRSRDGKTFLIVGVYWRTKSSGYYKVDEGGNTMSDISEQEAEHQLINAAELAICRSRFPLKEQGETVQLDQLKNRALLHCLGRLGW
ncbi:MAG: hypothetical protein HY336_01480 [Candidatus Doudnabacteria bacterium]|nr:hypothetical protein [Candidatus Doudnabacteria bacterium]